MYLSLGCPAGEGEQNNGMSSCNLATGGDCCLSTCQGAVLGSCTTEMCVDPFALYGLPTPTNGKLRLSQS